MLPVIGFFFGSQYQRGAASQVNNVNSEFFNTEVSEKPRDKVISYTVQPGDTLPMVSRRFNISEDTIRWENKLVNDRLIEGQILQILPVTGITHVVVDGDTVQSLAEVYKTDPQKIIEFPFNEFENPETFSLTPGKTIIIPDGMK